MIHHLHCENCAKEFTVESTADWIIRPECGFLCPACSDDPELNPQFEELQ